MEVQERRALSDALRNAEEDAKEALDTLAQARESIFLAVWPFEGRDLDEAVSGPELDEIVESAHSTALALPRTLEAAVDVREGQAALARKLAPFDPYLELRIDPDEVITLRTRLEGWTAVTVSDQLVSAAGLSPLIRHAIRRALRQAGVDEMPSWEKLRAAEAHALEWARQTIEDLRPVLERGGHCSNISCDRLDMRGQGPVCDTCGERTLCEDNRTDFGAAAEALA